jgi:hypothetical protein
MLQDWLAAIGTEVSPELPVVAIPRAITIR